MRSSDNVAVLYNYGALAWVWRAFIVVGLILGGVSLAGFVSLGESWLLLAAAALLAPLLFFGTVLVVHADRIEDDAIEVRTLLFWRRRIEVNRLGPPSVRVRYRNGTRDLSAPRVWVPVRGTVPIYFDLLGHIPDRQAFLKTIRLNAATLRRAE